MFYWESEYISIKENYKCDQYISFIFSFPYPHFFPFLISLGLAGDMPSDTPYEENISKPSHSAFLCVGAIISENNTSMSRI